MLKSNFKQKYLKEIKQLAIKHNVPEAKVVDIYFKQFEYVAESIKKYEKITIKLRGLGKFVYSELRANKITEFKKQKDEREILPKSPPQNGDGTQSN